MRDIYQYINYIVSMLLVTLLVIATTSKSLAVNFSILKDDADVYVRYGETITYDVEFSNYEHRDLVDVIIEDTIPVGTTFVATDDWVCPDFLTGQVVPEGITCTYNVGTIPEGTYNFTIPDIMTVNVLEGTYLPSITNWMYVTELSTDTLLATSNVTTPIFIPEVYASIYSTSQNYQCFTPLPYTITASNYREMDIYNFKMQFVLPPELISQSPEWNCDIDNLCEYDYGTLPAYTTIDIPFNAVVEPSIACDNEPITIDLDIPGIENINEDYAYSTIYVSPIVDITPTIDMNKELLSLEETSPGEYLATIRITITNNTEDNFIAIDALEDLTLLDAFDGYSLIEHHTVGCDSNPNFDGDTDKNLLAWQTFDSMQTCQIYYTVSLTESTNALYDIDTDVILYYFADSVIWEKAVLEFDLEGYIYSPGFILENPTVHGAQNIHSVKEKINNKYKEKKSNGHNTKNLNKKK